MSNKDYFKDNLHFPSNAFLLLLHFPNQEIWFGDLFAEQFRTIVIANKRYCK